MQTEPETPGRRQPPPASAEEALARARDHARNSVAEALEAVRALLDAASFAARGAPSDAHPLLSQASRVLGGLAADLDARRGGGEDSLVAALAAALDAEIGRWEERASEDGDARSVLRAFLGVRELLWELGVRGAEKPDADAARSRGRPRGGPGRRRGPRVQRVPVES